MPAVVIECNAYGCKHMSPTGNLCRAEAVTIKGLRCQAFMITKQGDDSFNPRCRRMGNGKWVSCDSRVLK